MNSALATDLYNIYLHDGWMSFREYCQKRAWGYEYFCPDQHDDHVVLFAMTKLYAVEVI